LKNVLSTLGLIFLSACRSYQGPVSDHFDGKVFRNPWAPMSSSLVDVLRWKVLGDSAKEWPKWVDIPKNPVIPPQFQKGEVSVTFVNHASFLIQVGGLSILTDPVWSEGVSPVSFVGPKRVHAPGIAFDELPKINAVLVSHNHYDHMDVATLQSLSRRDKPAIYVPLGDKQWLSDEDVQNVAELDWWDKVTLSEQVSVYFAPSQHWSARGLHDRNRSLWGSYLIEYKGKFIYIGGDTGYGPHFVQTVERFPKVEIALALLPIGAYEPRWFMEYQHMNPSDTLKAFNDLKAHYGIGMHFGCWQLTDEGRDEPGIMMTKELQKAGMLDRFVVPEVGGTYRYSF
jgi:L-ascorbate metabolism protein UlaG (beta-lactamase superfamily)